MSWNGWGIWGSQAGRGTWAGGGGNQSKAAATPKQSNHRRIAGGRKQLILERPQEVTAGYFETKNTGFAQT